MERVDIAPDGDVVLAVANAVELRVSSVVLSLASPVFKAMLGPNFAEGQALRSSNTTTPKIIPLPEDNPQAMQLLCCVVHHQHEKIQACANTEDLLNFGMAVDKYECSNAVKYASNSFLRALGERGDSAILNTAPDKMLEAAYLLNDAECFAKFTAFVNRSNQSDRARLAQRSAPEVVIRINGELLAREAEVIALLSNDIEALVSQVGMYLHKNSNHERDHAFDKSVEEMFLCGELRRLVHDVLATLAGAALWPQSVRGSTLHAFLEDISALEIAGFLSQDAANLCSTCSNEHIGRKVVLAVSQLKYKAERVFAGLCLDCFKAGGNYEGSCRFVHDK